MVSQGTLSKQSVCGRTWVLMGSNVVNELCELHCISLLLFSFSPKEILNFNLKQSVPRRHQSAEVKPPSPRQACSSHHQIVIWICFWFSICKAQQKWKQILRRKCCLPSPHLFPTWMEQNLENCDNIEVLVRVTTTGMRCNQCDYDCYDASGLRAHLKELVWRSSKYSQCDFASSRAGNLRKHLKTHSGEKSDKCIQCIFSCRWFEETFDNTQCRRIKKMQPVWLRILSGRQFEETS